MNVSVVIPTYNRITLLRKTVPALVNQRVDGFTYEVIFVSNGSTDETDQFLTETAERYPERIRYRRIHPTGGPSAPRNVGIRAARADVVIILDDDVLPEEDLVLEHAKFHRRYPEPNYAAVGEAYVPSHMVHDPMTFFHEYPYDKVCHLERLNHLNFWTCNVSVKRPFILEAGLFDESLLFFEDIELARRLSDQDMYLKFLPTARGQHLHQLEPSGIPAKGEFTGRWLYAFLQGHPDRESIDRFGVLSPALGPRRFARRLINRVGLRMLNTPPIMAFLRMLGTRKNRRSRLSDLYYYVIFRRNMLAGYAAAKREAATDQKDRLNGTRPEWINRGEG